MDDLVKNENDGGELLAGSRLVAGHMKRNYSLKNKKKAKEDKKNDS